MSALSASVRSTARRIHGLESDCRGGKQVQWVEVLLADPGTPVEPGPPIGGVAEITDCFPGRHGIALAHPGVDRLVGGPDAICMID